MVSIKPKLFFYFFISLYFFTDLENQLKEIKADFGRLQELLGSELSSINVNLMQLLKSQNQSEEADRTFPIETKEDLVKLQEKLKDSNEDGMVKIVQKLIRRLGRKKNLHNLLAEGIIKTYNYDGLQNKESFKNFYHVDSLFFKAAESEVETYDNYKQTMRTAFKFEKQKLYKEKYLKEKKESCSNNQI